MSQSVSLRVLHKQEFLRDCAFHIFALLLHSKPPAQCLDPAEPLGILGMLGVQGVGPLNAPAFTGCPL